MVTLGYQIIHHLVGVKLNNNHIDRISYPQWGKRGLLPFFILLRPDGASFIAQPVYI
jgi:hypothetical protein